MVTTSQDLMVFTEADFDRLPGDGMFEVVDGRVILVPGNDPPHARLTLALSMAFANQLTPASGFVFPNVNVFVPPPADSSAEIQNRVPDLAVSTFEPGARFRADRPPELVVEILSTRRGNVECTEQIDDYARAGIGEYWVVDPFARVVEVYLLENGDYVLQPYSAAIIPRAFRNVTIDVRILF
jgi:Uma2 family endonuclease